MRKSLFFISGMLLLLSSCVPKAKLLNEQARVKALQSDSSSTHTSLNECNQNLNKCNSSLDSTIGMLNSLENEKADIKRQMAQLSLTSQATINSSKLTIAQQNKRLNDLEALINAQREMVNNLKKTVANALVNFKPDELSVYIKEGKLYVSMQEKLLFKSGSAVVDPKGKTALQKLATVLNSSPDINVMIEGHTDTVPISGKFEDNWALSVSRATSIVRILTDDYKVDSHKIIASGRSEFYPVASNKTAEGRARNRRTEIVLSPDLTPLFKLLEQ